MIKTAQTLRLKYWERLQLQVKIYERGSFYQCIRRDRDSHRIHSVVTCISLPSGNAFYSHTLHPLSRSFYAVAQDIIIICTTRFGDPLLGALYRDDSLVVHWSIQPVQSTARSVSFRCGDYLLRWRTRQTQADHNGVVGSIVHRLARRSRCIEHTCTQFTS